MNNNIIQFIIELTNKCNFQCKYCYLEQAESISNNSLCKMEESTGIFLMEYLYLTFKDSYEKIYIDFLDGEPLLNYEVMKSMVLKGEELEGESDKFLFRFTTNGSLLNSEIVKFTTEHNIYFNISIDGLLETHDINRKFPNGEGTGKIVYEKLKLVLGLDNVGIVSTYSANTYYKMLEGTQWLMNFGIKHIEVNFCMGKVDYYEDIEKLKGEYTKVINMYLSRYKIGDFSCTYVVLDNVLKSLFLNSYIKSNCVYPFKITYDGKIKSCDRIPAEYNKIILDTRIGMPIWKMKLTEHHYCNSKKVEKCEKCSVRSLCTPCVAYISDMFENKDVFFKEPIFCAIMKCLIQNSLEFYENNKDNLRVIMYFNPKVREQILKGNFEMV